MDKTVSVRVHSLKRTGLDEKAGRSGVHDYSLIITAQTCKNVKYPSELGMVCLLLLNWKKDRFVKFVFFLFCYFFSFYSIFILLWLNNLGKNQGLFSGQHTVNTALNLKN